MIVLVQIRIGDWMFVNGKLYHKEWHYNRKHNVRWWDWDRVTWR